MSTFALIHGGGTDGRHFHLVAAELRARGHDVVAPDLPGDPAATLDDYADAVIEAIGARTHVVVVGHSFGAFTAPLVAARLPEVDALVLVAGMVPKPGESPDEWWAGSGYGTALAGQSAKDGGLTGNEDPYVSFYRDVPRELADEELAREREHPSGAASAQAWPLEKWPDVPTRYLVCADDLFFPPEFLRGLARERIGVEPDEMPGGHCVALSRPAELAERLAGYAAG